MTAKPRIRADPGIKLPAGRHFWECSRDPVDASIRVCGYGYSPVAAYRSWEFRAGATPGDSSHG